MRMDRLTTSLQNALAESQSLALGQDHNQIDTVHLLLALLEQPSSSVKEPRYPPAIPNPRLGQTNHTLGRMIKESPGKPGLSSYLARG